MNTPTIMPLIKSCLSCTKHILIGGGFLYGASTSCIPIFTPLEIYNEEFLDTFQEKIGIPKYRSDEETNAFRQTQFLKLWDNRTTNQSITLPNGRINVIKINDLIKKTPWEMYKGKRS